MRRIQLYRSGSLRMGILFNAVYFLPLWQMSSCLLHSSSDMLVGNSSSKHVTACLLVLQILKATASSMSTSLPAPPFMKQTLHILPHHSLHLSPSLSTPLQLPNRTLQNKKCHIQSTFPPPTNPAPTSSPLPTPQPPHQSAYPPPPLSLSPSTPTPKRGDGRFLTPYPTLSFQHLLSFLSQTYR